MERGYGPSFREVHRGILAFSLLERDIDHVFNRPLRPQRAHENGNRKRRAEDPGRCAPGPMKQMPAGNDARRPYEAVEVDAAVEELMIAGRRWR
jgi:hypothetical protein